MALRGAPTLALALLLLLQWQVLADADTTTTATTTANSSLQLDYLGNNASTVDPSLDYEIDESLMTYDWWEIGPTLVVYPLTMVLGLAGNALIIFTTQRYRRMQSTTNVFLASLASADLLLIIVCIPVKLAKLMSFTWTAGFFLCKAVHYMQNVTAMCSVFTLTAMSIERYYAIIHPMKVKYMCSLSDTRKICAVIWAAAFVLATPIYWAIDYMPVGPEGGGYYWCVRDFYNEAYLRYHDLYSLVVILVVPSGIMMFTYTIICWEVWHVMLQRCQMASGKGLSAVESMPLSGMKRAVRESIKRSVGQSRLMEETQTVKQVTKMLVAVVVVFIVCWSPLLIDNLLTSYGVLPHSYERVQENAHYKYMNVCFTLLCYFNSCVNPIVYGFMSRSFRESFQQALCRCCKTRASNRQPSLNTKTTSIRLNERRRARLFRQPPATT